MYAEKAFGEQGAAAQGSLTPPPDTSAVLTDEQADALRALGETLFSEFDLARKLRRSQEDVWLENLRQLKGIYDPETMARIGHRRSKVFIRMTRAKLRAIDARVRDLLFPAGDKNWAIEPTPVQELVEDKHLAAVARLMMARMQTGVFQPPSSEEALAYVQKEAADACARMEEQINDQLTELEYERHAVKVQHNAHLYGCGILKGPLSEEIQEFVWQPELPAGGIPLETQYALVKKTRLRPWIGAVNPWRFYVDPQALAPSEAEYFWEEHILTRADLLRLAKRRGFNQDAIRAHLAAYPHGDDETPQHWETALQQMPEGYDYVGALKNRYRLRERWGYLSGRDLRNAGMDIPKEMLEEAIEARVYLLGRMPVKASKNPLPGEYGVYHFYYFDKDETSFWGEGIAGVYEHPQKMVNASIRMALDNGAISSGPQIEANRSLLDDEDDFESVVPFRMWIRTGLGKDATAPALRVYDITSKVKDHLELLRVAKDLGDEISSAPSYAYGQPSSQAANTLGGLSILMGNVNITLKDLAAGWDRGITAPFIKAMYAWNMAFNPRKDIKGDFRVKPIGVTSLLAKELRSHALETFRMSTANPIDGPFTKRVALLRETAKALDLPPNELVATDDEIENYKTTGIASWVIPPPPMIGPLPGQGMPAGSPLPGNPAALEVEPAQRQGEPL
jgi:hypothetical protein